MFIKKKIYWITVIIAVLSFNSVVWARTSHDVAINIAEIGRYHVENQSVTIKGNDIIQSIEVKILSNSNRKWRLIAVPYENCQEIQWSTDNRTWHEFQSGTGTMFLTGEKSDWKKYRLYIKVKGVSQEAVSLGYQLLFNE